jgi:chemotaxis protein MotB
MNKLQDFLQISEQESFDSRFIVSFADLMTLLVTFFVMLVGMSQVDKGSFDTLRSKMSGREEGTLLELAKTFKQQAQQLSGVSISYDKDGVRIHLDSAAIFDTGSAELRPGSLDSVAKLLRTAMASPYKIDVEGHTDDRHFYRQRQDTVDTNWSLSGRRASSVVHHLLDMGFPERRLRIIGYAANSPTLAPEGLYGARLEEARARNRRVSILVH